MWTLSTSKKPVNLLVSIVDFPFSKYWDEQVAGRPTGRPLRRGAALAEGAQQDHVV
jgi:hypothetical protein